jgi:hypothetical protein
MVDPSERALLEEIRDLIREQTGLFREQAARSIELQEEAMRRQARVIRLWKVLMSLLFPLMAFLVWWVMASWR